MDNMDGYTDTPHVKGSKASKHVKGCPENDNGPHVYVWVPTGTIYQGHEKRVCAGCGHRRKTGSFRVTTD